MRLKDHMSCLHSFEMTYLPTFCHPICNQSKVAAFFKFIFYSKFKKHSFVINARTKINQ